MKLPSPPPPEGPIRFRPAPLNEDRVRQGRRNQAVVAARKAEEGRRQRDEEEKYPLLDLGDGRPPIRVRSTGGPETHPRTGYGVQLGRLPLDPLGELSARVDALAATVAELVASDEPEQPKRRWRRG